jgi:hypothetical protein
MGYGIGYCTVYVRAINLQVRLNKLCAYFLFLSVQSSNQLVAIKVEEPWEPGEQSAGVDGRLVREVLERREGGNVQQDDVLRANADGWAEHGLG